MYNITDITTNTNYVIHGDYPILLIEKLVKTGHNIVVVSTYSKHISYNFAMTIDGELRYDRIAL